MSYKEHENAIHQLRISLSRRGFKAYFRLQKDFGRGEGVNVSVIDPVDPNTVFFACFLSWDDLEIVNTGNTLFWRHVL